MPSLLTSVLTMSCPRCRRGKVFKVANPYIIKSVGDIHHLCPVCGQNFRPEPGFYFGAAVVSYPLTVIFSLLVAFVFHLITGDIFDHFLAFMITLSISLVIVLPIAFRYSRIIWLHIIMKYAPDAVRK